MASNRDLVQELQEILKGWEDIQSTSTSDPTPHLIQLCELFERETENFLKKDPDPFDDRHPIASQPDCALGHLLRALFKKDTFVTKVMGSYLRENYFTSLGVSQDSLPLNTAACRLLVDLLIGLDTPQIFEDSESIVSRFFIWAEKGPEPIRSYSCGLLAAAMDIPDIAAQFKDQNSRLVPIMLKRLWELKDEECHDTELNGGTTLLPERPFAHFNQNGFVNGKKEGCKNHSSSEEKTRTPVKRNTAFCSPTMVNGLGSDIDKISPEKHVGEGQLSSHDLPSFLNSDCSNSSWAEMSSYILGTYQMFPVTKETKMIFMLMYLRPVGEYQESLSHVFEHNALELIFHYTNVRHTNHSRLSFEALRFLGSLLFHKKFCLEFTSMGGIQKLLQVPRPSLPADGVALCLWYLAYCEEAFEQICLMPDHILTELIKYSLWLLECAHQSSRTHAVMFFGMVFRFRAILEKFDEQDGLRKMLNMLSTMSIFQDSFELEISNEPNEAMMWQTIKQVCLSVKNYFEAHLTVKVHQLQRFTSISSPSSCSSSPASSYQTSTPAYKAVSIDPEAVERNVEYLLENLPFKARWKPVEQFVALKGLELFLQLIATVINDSFAPKMDAAVHALDALYICSILPSVQAALCDKQLIIPNHEDLLQTLNPQEVPGYAILVACISDTLSLSNSAEVQKASLRALINCVCSPIHRPGSVGPSISSNKTVSTPSSSRKKAHSSEEVLKKSWDCVRTSNGIMYLLNLLHKKTPITDADCIRALACRALVGLARSDTARQIMSKLPVFTSGQLQLLMKEPILQDKRIEHVKFQKHIVELVKAVSGRNRSQEGDVISDVSMLSIHKANVVAQTKIKYNRLQLLQLIQSYLLQEGYESVANSLQEVANLPQLPSFLLPPGYTNMGPPSRGVGTPPPPSLRQHWLLNGTNRQIYSPSVSGPLSSTKSQVSVPLPASQGLPNTSSGPPSSALPNGDCSSSIMTPIHIRISRNGKKDAKILPSQLLSPSLPLSPSANALQGSAPLGCSTNKTIMNSTHRDTNINLDRIVVEYLTNQHSLCKIPMATCPEFDLFHPHRCPESKPAKSIPQNFTMRYSRHIYQRNLCGSAYRNLNRKFAYSRYKASHVIRSLDEDDTYLTCEFLKETQLFFVGTIGGQIRIYNKADDSFDMADPDEPAHPGSVTSLVPHSSGKLLLSSCSTHHESVLWTISSSNSLSNQFRLSNCHHAEFNTAEDKILGTNEQTAKLYDLSSSQCVSEFMPKLSNHYKVNKATLDPADELVLTDGVLFDIRSGRQIHKFDKMNPILNGTFHHNGLEIISSSEIWDLRTFHLLRTVPILSLCDISFNHTGHVIFGISVGNLDENQENAFETSFKTVDAFDYSNIATVDVKRIVSSLAINQTDTQIAVVEAENSNDDVFERAVVRIYDIGMVRQEEDETMDDEEEEEEDDDDDAMDASDMDTDDSDAERDSNNDDDNSSTHTPEDLLFEIRSSSSSSDSLSEGRNSSSEEREFDRLFENIERLRNWRQRNNTSSNDDDEYEDIEEEVIVGDDDQADQESGD